MSEILTLLPPGTIGDAEASGPLLVLFSARGAVERLLALARTQLGMEVAIISEFAGDEQVIRHLEGDPEAFGLHIGAATRLADTYCWRVVANGRLSPVVPDARSDVRLRDLEVTWEADIGSYVGAPIRFSDGRIYGSLCCLSHSANPSLRERDAHFLTMVAALISDELEVECASHQKRLEGIERIRRVLERGGLGVAYQPIFDLHSLTIVGYEALARFEAGGSPDRWFAEAAEIGLGPDLERAASQVALAHLGELPPGSYVWVNLSPRAMGSSTIRDMLAEAPGDRIIAGLIPAGPIEDGLEEAVRALKTRGVRLAVDRVGGEHPALRDILRLQPDILRLDPVAVGAIESDPSSRHLVSFLVRFSSELGVVTVAEGIETPGVLNVLRDLGVVYGQGFALAPPLSLRDLAWPRRGCDGGPGAPPDPSPGPRPPST